MRESQRLRVWDRAEGRCEVVRDGVRCGRPGAEVDHVEAKGMGGRHGAARRRSESDENLRVICLSCHRARHDGLTVR